MIIFRYDKTWEGLLTAVFDAYARRAFPDLLLAEDDPGPIFADETLPVRTDPERAGRVWRGLRRRVDRRVCNMLVHVWLSEDEGADALIMRYLRKVFDAPDPHAVVMNFADPDVLAVHKTALKVSREGEHVRQFLRFQKAADGSWFAPVAPKYNALPLALDYLRDRFADQRWLVYDTKRRYGYLFDTQQVMEITMDDDAHLIAGKLDDAIMAGDEKLFQDMWRKYFDALTIRERVNPRLQRRNMPRRFWKYLTEKQ